MAVTLMVVSAAGLLSAAAPAWAHATLVASTPNDGARLDDSPAVLTFDLNEPVSLVEGSAQLIDTEGTRFPLTDALLEDGRKRIVLGVGETLPDGAYLATARVVSADTHVVSLSIRFAVGAVAEQGQWDVSDRPAVDRGVLLAVKILVYLGTAGSAGLMAAARWAWPDTLGTPHFRTVYRFGTAVLLLGLLARFAVLTAEQAGAVADTSWSAAASIARTPVGFALLVAAVVGVAALARPPRRTGATFVLGLLQALTALVAVTLGGHGGSANRWPLPFMATFVHVYAIAVWLGGLALIALVHRSIPELRRWHRVAIGHGVLLLAAGTVLALLQVRPVAALVTTSYGLTLVVKIALAAAAFTAGILAYRAGTGNRARIVAIETVLALAIVGVTSSLSSVTPARDSYTTNVATLLDFGDSEVLDVDIDTVRRGAQVVTVVAPGHAQIGVELSSVQANVARLPVKLSPGPGDDGAVVWRSTGLIVPAPGRWKVTVRFEGEGGTPKLASFFYEVL
jgi:copper transport protein